MLTIRSFAKLFSSVVHQRNFSHAFNHYQKVTEIVKLVDPYSKIRIKCSCNLRIIPYDLLDCPDANRLRATLSSDTSELKVVVAGQDVTIENDGDTKSSPDCLLEIPIKADLDITNRGSTEIKDLYSDEVRLRSDGKIVTKNLRSTIVDLESTNGDISCGGTTLAQIIRVSTNGTGNILLDKLQGGDLEAESNSGSISVNSSYCNNSKFTTNGDLILKNIHKQCQVNAKGSGKFVMNGFYGSLQADVESQRVELQISEITGDSSVNAPLATEVSLAVSDTVLQNVKVSITSSEMKVDPSFDEKQNAISKEGATSHSFGPNESVNRFQLYTGGSVQVKKMSWTDSFGFNLKKEN
ncbi:protein FAM185A-like [Uranotaenia lowii]|uniref:protein FAM185A-like n=1 Tax=Uranotaenia lowii TaxID=190385 RepID=UPI002478CEFB|nr:protein FAM185A-like [Uranotaenia lowii]